MTRARLSSLSTVLNSLGSLARVLLITGVDKTMGVAGYHSEEGIQLMVSRLRMMCLGLGILSTVMGCAATPPSPVATLPPAAPSSSRAACAAACSSPSCNGSPSLRTPFLYDGKARRLPTLSIRA